ncbi:MAG TPA: cell division protein ZapE [Gammaproteobacteria bacterium]|nr:cell division protein ZapE [Gammaproteobacteria bacterium]
MTSPASEYRRRVDAGELADDCAQAAAIEALERLHRELVEAGPPLRGWRRRVRDLTGQQAAPPLGVYLWGKVGRGKTLMMDLFYECLPFDDKIRQHFHRFMAAVHSDLKRFRRRADPLDLAAERLAATARVICFDELIVADIADAMILARLFEGLFSRGVALAATSNLAPRELYTGGLQRQRFLPAIDLIERRTQVVQVGGDLDYRLELLEKSEVYLHPSGAEAERRVGEYFRRVAGQRGEACGRIEVLGRPIEFRREWDGIIWFDFEQICDGPRSQDDYIELSKLYHTVLVSGVPQFDAALENQARRFIALVDEFYDRRVKLILSAQSAVESLYCGGRLERDFERTASRLQEMQSREYLAAERRT